MWELLNCMRNQFKIGNVKYDFQTLGALSFISAIEVKSSFLQRRTSFFIMKNYGYLPFQR